MPDDAGSAAPSGHAVADADRLTVEAVEVGVNLEPCPVAHLPAREGHVKTRGASSIWSERPDNRLGVEDSNLGIRTRVRCATRTNASARHGTGEAPRRGLGTPSASIGWWGAEERARRSSRGGEGERTLRHLGWLSASRRATYSVVNVTVLKDRSRSGVIMRKSD